MCNWEAKTTTTENPCPIKVNLCFNFMQMKRHLSLCVRGSIADDWVGDDCAMRSWKISCILIRLPICLSAQKRATYIKIMTETDGCVRMCVHFVRLMRIQTDRQTHTHMWVYNIAQSKYYNLTDILAHLVPYIRFDNKRTQTRHKKKLESLDNFSKRRSEKNDDNNNGLIRDLIPFAVFEDITSSLNWCESFSPLLLLLRLLFLLLAKILSELWEKSLSRTSRRIKMQMSKSSSRSSSIALSLLLSFSFLPCRRYMCHIYLASANGAA